MKSRFWHNICNIDLFLAIIALAVLVIVTFVGVFMRYTFNDPFVWLDEVQMTVIVWLTCFGASAAIRHGGHIAIDMFVTLLPAKIQKAVGVVTFLVIITMLGFLAWNSFGLVGQQLQFKRVTDILLLPRGYIFAALPVSTCMMILSFIANGVNEILHPKTAPNAQKGEV